VGRMKKGQKLMTAEKKFSFWLAAAAVMHAFVLFLALYIQLWDSGWHVKPKIVSVSLVTLPGSGGAGMHSESPGENSSPPLAEHAVKEPVPEKLQPVAPKQVPAEPLKPKVVDKPADINLALERLKLQVAKKTPPSSQPSASSSLNKALADLQQKVKNSGRQAGTGSGEGRSGSSGSRSSGGKGSGSGGTADPYKAKIAEIIQQNWAFSKQLLKNSYGMNVFVRINILADGTIRQIVFDKRAPSEYLNNSVKKALEKSSPLPVIPKEEGARDVWIGFVFTPEGIE
jgi:colicin import membrane protein